MIVQNNTLAELSLTVEQAFDFNTTLNAVQGGLDVNELSRLKKKMSFRQVISGHTHEFTVTKP